MQLPLLSELSEPARRALVSPDDTSSDQEPRSGNRAIPQRNSRGQQSTGLRLQSLWDQSDAHTHTHITPLGIFNILSHPKLSIRSPDSKTSVVLVLQLDQKQALLSSVLSGPDQTGSTHQPASGIKRELWSLNSLRLISRGRSATTIPLEDRQT